MGYSALKQLSKQIYRQMVSRTPDIGSMMENPLRVCLTVEFYGCLSIRRQKKK